MIKIKIFVFNPFQVNCFVVYDETNQCVIIDASCYHPGEYDSLYNFISANSLTPVAVLNTHGHVDHLTGTSKVCAKYSIGLAMHSGDLKLLENAVAYGRTFGFDIETPPQPQSWLNDNEVFRFGNSELTAFHAPGHSSGSLLFYFKDANFLITGDVLFEGSIGRTDLPGGDYNQLIRSIQTKIMVLPMNTVVYPGHGPSTTIGNEKDHNPFLNRSS
jgi:glyoxylase-like metal-dependent hydrolase (beta-lactamase superfamily II)